MSTVQQIVDGAAAKSAAFRPDSIGTGVAFISRVGMCLREWFDVCRRENPYLLGTSALLTFDGTGWPRPADCLSGIKVYASAGTIASPAITPGSEILVVPFDDQAIALGFPSLTEFGQRFVGTGQLIDPTGGTVTLLYARGPVMPAALGDSIDALFPSMFDDFLSYDLAAFQAQQDERGGDVQTFLSNKSGILSLMVEWARGQTYGVQARHTMVNPPHTNVGGGRQAGGSGG